MINKKNFLSFLFLFTSFTLLSMENLPIAERYAIACQKNDLSALEKCITENPNLNIAEIENEYKKNERNISGLRMLCYPTHNPNDQEKVNKKLELAKTLIARGAPLNVTEYFTEKTPLHYACMHADKALITLLIQNGANTSLKDKSNKTAYDLLPSAQISHMREKLSNEKPNCCFSLVYHLLMINESADKKPCIKKLIPDVSNIIWDFYKKIIIKEMATEKWIWEPVCIEANRKNGITNQTKEQCLINILFWSKDKKLEINKKLTPAIISGFLTKNVAITFDRNNFYE